MSFGPDDSGEEAQREFVWRAFTLVLFGGISKTPFAVALYLAFSIVQDALPVEANLPPLPEVSGPIREGKQSLAFVIPLQKVTNIAFSVREQVCSLAVRFAFE